MIALAAGGVYTIASGSVVESAALLGLAAVGGVALVFQRTLPSAIFLLLLLAAGVNAAGYVMGLWHERTLFDETVHAFTTFAGMIAIAWVSQLSGRLTGANAFQIIALTLFAGLFLGLLWEGFEWIIGIIGNRRDTLIDLAMDSLGAVAAGLFHTAHMPRRGAETTYSYSQGSQPAP